MNVAITFKNFQPSDHLKKYARRRFEKLLKFTDSENVAIEAMLRVEKFRHIAEISLVGDNLNIAAAEESEDMYASVDMVRDKLEAQLRKNSDRKKDRRAAVSPKMVSVETFSLRQDESGKRERAIVETDAVEPKPMFVDEAAEQLDALGNEFIVFRNAETQRINVIYHKKNKDFGLIDPEG